ncbi:MAG: thioredoxin family protein [Syntrophobacteraceae bacterium]
MAEKDITRITISGFGVSIVGLKALMEAIAGDYRDASDEQIRDVMLRELEKDNYIPAKVRQNYGDAFVREFRKHLGQPFREEAPQGLDIKVLGAGCTQCDHLTKLVMEVLTELGIPAGVEHVMDMKEIARYGVMGVPALLINRKVVATGSVPPRDRIKKWLSEAHANLPKAG